MKWIRNVVVGLVIIGFVDSCIKEPEYSNVPHIDLKSIVYKKGTRDTIIFTLKFTDGDGNLGLGNDPLETELYSSSSDSIDVNTPFYFIYDTIQNKIVYYDHVNDRDLSTIGTNLSYVDYKAKRTLPYPFDTLPALSCDHYEYPSQGGGQTDTLYYLKNLNYYNIFVSAYFKNGNTYTLYNPNDYNTNGFSQFCIGNFLNGRFPILASDLGKNSPLDGTIIYKYSSAGLPPFRGQTVKFKIYITDRTGIPDQNVFLGIRLQRSNVDSATYQF